jgi:hypothetical protein
MLANKKDVNYLKMLALLCGSYVVFPRFVLFVKPKYKYRNVHANKCKN